DFMIAVHDRIHDPKLAKKDDPARHVAAAITGGAKLICFDEMEVRDIADAMIVARVMEGFFDDGGVMVSTSNRHPDGLYENGLHRERFLPFIDLLKKTMIIHDMDSDTDWRQRVLSGLPSWYTPNDAMSRQSLLAAFDQLSGGVEVAPVTVTVKGRDITFDHAAGSIAAVSFDEICARPLAARDYIALADRYAGLLVHDIPRLDDTMRNEARRFMWLVDAFYDRQRFLVCSAAVKIPDLYQGNSWKVEFPRTVSRLTEMTNI
ncbi:MAG: cell division protein ZapE, partial [Alphaproteobacteria bacterium]|nr:cell division protein ZapE [Alphaproteobacteria bacterium]